MTCGTSVMTFIPKTIRDGVKLCWWPCSIAPDGGMVGALRATVGRPGHRVAIQARADAEPKVRQSPAGGGMMARWNEDANQRCENEDAKQKREKKGGERRAGSEVRLPRYLWEPAGAGVLAVTTVRSHFRQKFACE